MVKIYESMGVMIGFCFLIMLVQNFIGDKASETLVLICLVSVLLANTNKLTGFLGGMFEEKAE